MKPLEVVEGPWKDITYDMIVKLPISKIGKESYDSIFMVVDRYSKMVHYYPCRESMTPEDLARLFIDKVWRYHGLPSQTTSDRGTTFGSKFTCSLYSLLGIEPHFSMAYHPKTNALSERANQWVEGYLKSFCNYQQDDWASCLPLAEFAHNNQVNQTTGKTPFQVLYGYEPQWHPELFSPNIPTAPEADTLAQRIKEIWQECMTMLEFNHDLPADETRFKEGDHVWLLATNIKSRRPTKKLDDKKLGPFEILERISDYAYRLKLPPTMRTHDVFHAKLLFPYKSDDNFLRNQPRPPAVVTEEGEEEYKVEKIISWVQDKKGLRYRVHWKAYSNQEDTEERAEKFTKMHELMEDFLKRDPSAPVPNNYQPRSTLRRSPRNIQRSPNQTANSALLVPTPATHLSATPTPSL